MDIGNRIRALRNSRQLTQEKFAEDIGVTVQTVSRWENSITAPDLSQLPILSKYFKVTTDFLLGIEGEPIMAKLIKTVETFEVATKEEADKMIENFKNVPFPKLKDYSLKEENGLFILETLKVFNLFSSFAIK